jgi:4'-phosphopantetheinyl transferase
MNTKDFFPGAITLEISYTPISAAPPPLSPWSGTALNRCAHEEIPAYWDASDILTFLADLGMHTDSTLPLILDRKEKEQEQVFKTKYFKERFTVSRSILKHILAPILEANDPTTILLSKEKEGRIMVHGRPDIFISLSYSGTCIAVSVAKRKIGSDIEVVRPLGIRKARRYSLVEDSAGNNRKEGSSHFLQVWTMMESYAKLCDMNLYPLIQDRFFFGDARFVSYLIDRHTILTLAYKGDPLKDTLLWIDPEHWQHCSSSEKNIAQSSAITDGDICVRS